MATVIVLIFGLVLVIVCFKSLATFKRLPNNSYYNVYHNSRYYRLLLALLVSITSIVAFIVINFF